MARLNAETIQERQGIRNAKTAYANDIRKREREYTRTKEALAKTFSDAYKGTKVKFTLTNPLKAKVAGASKSVDHTYNLVDSHLAERESLLLDENHKLRIFLLQTWEQIHSALGTQRVEDRKMFEMPWDMTEKRLGHIMQHLTTTLQEYKDTYGDQKQSNIAVLESQLVEQKAAEETLKAKLCKDTSEFYSDRAELRT